MHSTFRRCKHLIRKVWNTSCECYLELYNILSIHATFLQFYGTRGRYNLGKSSKLWSKNLIQNNCIHMIGFAIVVQSAWTQVVATCVYVFVVIIQMLANIDLLIQSLRPQMVCGWVTATSTHNPHISGHYKSHIHTTKRRQEITFTYRLLLSFCMSFFLSLGPCTMMISCTDLACCVFQRSSMTLLSSWTRRTAASKTRRTESSCWKPSPLHVVSVLPL